MTFKDKDSGLILEVEMTKGNGLALSIWEDVNTLLAQLKIDRKQSDKLAAFIVDQNGVSGELRNLV